LNIKLQNVLVLFLFFLLVSVLPSLGLNPIFLIDCIS
jgi:hypothetical protein